MATLKELLGDKLKDGMTVEQITALDVDLVDKKAYEGYVPKTTLDKAMADAAEWKNKFRQTQSDADRQAAELEEKNKERDNELNQLRRDKQIYELKGKYLSQGYDDELAQSSAVATIDNDYSTLFANMTKFAESVKQNNISQQQSNTPKPPVNNSTKPQTVNTSEMTPYEYIKYQNDMAAEANN